MRIGLFTILTAPNASPDVVRAFATQADARGFHSIWLAEHAVLFDRFASKYPYSPDGTLIIPPNEGILEPFTTMAFMAACTSRIRLGTGVLILPQRNPLYTAKEVSNLDYLSNGRIDLGIGIGWLKEEFEALGVEWARRGKRTDEYIQILKNLWCDDVSLFSGEFHSFGPCRMHPKPVQKPHTPIHVGGNSEPALRRAARFGQGWHGVNHTPPAAAAAIGKLGEFAKEYGRSKDEIDITLTAPIGEAVTIDDVKRYRDAGVGQLVVAVFAATAQTARDTVDDLADRILEPAAAF